MKSNAQLLLRIPLLVSSLFAGCAVRPDVPEVPIEEAQRRMIAESPVLVADACMYNRNLVYNNDYLMAESKDLGQQGAKEVIVGFKQHGISIKQFSVPIMCATEMPPRGDEKGGLIATQAETVSTAKSYYFPIALNDALGKDATLLAAYTQLFAHCDYKAYRKEKRYDCPLLKPEQAALLKARLKTSYIVALSIGGERFSTANRSAGALFGVLFGAINIGADAGSALMRLVNLDTGNLVYSSFPGEFSGQSAGDNYSGGSNYNGRSNNSDLRIDEKWVERMLKPLFEKQR